MILAPERRMGSRLRLALLLPLAVLVWACGGDSSSRPFEVENEPPIIRSITFSPFRVHASQAINVIAQVSDENPSNLRYFWSVTRGELPNGVSRSGVLWETAKERGIDTVTVRVTDLEDTVYASATVELLLPAEPGELTTVNFSNVADLEWSPSLDEGIRHWRGYQIYQGPEDLRGKSESEIAEYLVTPEPVLETRRRLLGLTVGERYVFHVRSLRRYDDVEERSPLSAPIDMAPRPEAVVLRFQEIGHVAGGHALDLSAGRHYPVDPDDPTVRPGLDLYLGTLDPEDGAAPPALKSVSALAYRAAGWAAREVLMKQIGDEAEDWEIRTTDDQDWSTSVPVAVNAVYAVKTPEGNYGKLRVNSFQGSVGARQIRLQWAYQTIPNYPSF